MVPSTREWLARICSISVEPERGRPTMKMGAGLGSPLPARAAKNDASKKARMRAARRSKCSMSNGASEAPQRVAARVVAEGLRVLRGAARSALPSAKCSCASFLRSPASLAEQPLHGRELRVAEGVVLEVGKTPVGLARFPDPSRAPPCRRPRSPRAGRGSSACGRWTCACRTSAGLQQRRPLVGLERLLPDAAARVEADASVIQDCRIVRLDAGSDGARPPRPPRACPSGLQCRTQPAPDERQVRRLPQRMAQQALGIVGHVGRQRQRRESAQGGHVARIRLQDLAEHASRSSRRSSASSAAAGLFDALPVRIGTAARARRRRARRRTAPGRPAHRRRPSRRDDGAGSASSTRRTCSRASPRPGPRHGRRARDRRARRRTRAPAPAGRSSSAMLSAGLLLVQQRSAEQPAAIEVRRIAAAAAYAACARRSRRGRRAAQRAPGAGSPRKRISAGSRS